MDAMRQSRKKEVVSTEGASLQDFVSGCVHLILEYDEWYV